MNSISLDSQFKSALIAYSLAFFICQNLLVTQNLVINDMYATSVLGNLCYLFYFYNLFAVCFKDPGYILDLQNYKDNPEDKQ